MSCLWRWRIEERWDPVSERWLSCSEALDTHSFQKFLLGLPFLFLLLLLFLLLFLTLLLPLWFPLCPPVSLLFENLKIYQKVFPSALVRSLGSWWASSLLLRWVDNFDNLDIVNTLDFVDIADDVDNCADGCWFPHGLVLMISHFLLIVSFYWRADIWNQKIQKCKHCYQIGETQVKSIASSISTTFNWTLAFLVTKFFSDMVINHGHKRWHYTHLRWPGWPRLELFGFSGGSPSSHSSSVSSLFPRRRARVSTTSSSSSDRRGLTSLRLVFGGCSEAVARMTRGPY